MATMAGTQGPRLKDENEKERINRERRLRRSGRSSKASTGNWRRWNGLLLRKSRPRTGDFGTYLLIDPSINRLLCTGTSIEDVERELKSIERRPLASRLLTSNGARCLELATIP